YRFQPNRSTSTSDGQLPNDEDLLCVRLGSFTALSGTAAPWPIQCSTHPRVRSWSRAVSHQANPNRPGRRKVVRESPVWATFDRARIVALRKEGMGATEIAQAVGCKRGNVYKALKA